ncbi:hypothetical protein N802_04430 [Knoellia sinensis KCTC 19936]|uniref:DUF1365 domain-containing protein n=1 Tax=Knoellia sinensis KCTC 19936 TaxID=1385520 RepID=A0A0A0J5G6_9MICO|nr:DUF1365 domain-containing protein [Knoellia sinensis]KGN31342.1 hypothetical protein N802_04430 [Knoellia sinensis KCTC 19936]
MVRPSTPSLVVGEVSHARRQPVVHRFRHRHYQWLVDVDDLPRLPWPLTSLARFDPRDHLAGGGAVDRHGIGIAGDVRRFCSERGRPLPDGTRILMLAHARALGHAFNPLTVFFCLDAEDRLGTAVLEVHNTYGERHSYVLAPDADGNASVDKAFYVSPFNDLSGSYAVRLRLDARRVGASIRLDRAGETVFTASAMGDPRPATVHSVLALSLRHPLMTYRVPALIRWHGIRLWLRRLPVVKRPSHESTPSQEAAR